ncbi:DUF3081 family protein [Ferrimonas lipolytica]|uniref:DUF3081 domain-containing protein n=1 Tax=Ferrimonas lipolytica TaxID=2724191 RepID=A0A6H1UGE4_9GAMM|nr:DUF3081 family protein [Ferrimonas lipolytica]QIZ77699.1 DUF3081 domain-containing protein [Ferrimonas lipolytica]
MSERIDVAPALHAVQLVIENGEVCPQGYKFEGFVADSDNDGYNVSLSHGAVELSIGFHNAYTLKSPNDAATERFLDCINQLLAGKKQGWVSH